MYLKAILGKQHIEKKSYFDMKSLSGAVCYLFNGTTLWHNNPLINGLKQLNKTCFSISKVFSALCDKVLARLAYVKCMLWKVKQTFLVTV